MQEHILKKFFEILNGSHYAFYRGKDITDLFYDGTLSKQIKAGTFDDIFIGDYIIGKTSKIKYLVADIDYHLNSGDPAIKTHHIIVIPENTMGDEKMNDDATATAYVGSKMYLTNLQKYKDIIKSDFGTEHILTYSNYFPNNVSNNIEISGTWLNTDIDLLNEKMVAGNTIYHNVVNGTTFPNNTAIDNTQLAIFRLKPSNIIAYADNGYRKSYWLRDVAGNGSFSFVGSVGYIHNIGAASSLGVRPFFSLI